MKLRITTLVIVEEGQVQDTWSEHSPTPGKLRPSNFGHMFCEPNSQFNKLLRTQNKLKSKRK